MHTTSATVVISGSPFNGRHRILRLIIATITMLVGVPGVNLEASAQSENMQTRCATRAEAAFSELTHEYEAVLERVNVPFEIKSNDYQAHYSGKADRCLFLVRKTASVLGSISFISYLLDADDRDMYAVYVERDGAIESCKLIKRPEGEKVCKDRGEFDVFVADYMTK